MRVSFQGVSTPYYFETLYCSFSRSFLRANHPTMSFGLTHSCKSIIYCLRRFCGADFSEIAERTGSKFLEFEYFNTQKLTENPELIKQLQDSQQTIHESLEHEEITDADAQIIFDTVTQNTDLQTLFTFVDQTTIDQTIAALVSEMKELVIAHSS